MTHLSWVSGGKKGTWVGEVERRHSGAVCAEQRPGSKQDPSKLEETHVKADVCGSVVSGETGVSQRPGRARSCQARRRAYAQESEQSSLQPVTVGLTIGWKEPGLRAGRPTWS